VLTFNYSLFWLAGDASALHDSTHVWNIINDPAVVNVCRGEVSSLEGTTVHLTDSTKHESDVVVFATGWDYSHKGLFSAPLAAKLGLPINIEDEEPKEAAMWTSLEENADKRILKRFPILEDTPEKGKPKPIVTPFRIYHHIAPPKFASEGDFSIAFLGVLINVNTSTAAEVSALWAIAYLEELIPAKASVILNDKPAMYDAIAQHQAWIARRYRSPTRPRAGMEIQFWLDTLLTELGCTAERRRGSGGVAGWYRENLTPWLCRDYDGIIDEFILNASLK
jgi:dimethylaniline monooxygenase (N-oxide forming)